MVTNKPKILLVAGARPNFMKIAPVYEALRNAQEFDLRIIHTGQHYDQNMSSVFFRELGIPDPHVNLGVGSGTAAEQTGKILIAFDAILAAENPDLVVVVGDVNSTVACSIAAVKRGIKVAHVEAGLRSFDWNMPEEINRVITDRLSDFLFCTEKSAIKNLKAEGIPAKKIFFVGNVMIDTLLKQKAKAEQSGILEAFRLREAYAVATLHRPSNVDSPETLRRLILLLQKISKNLRIILPVHPRTAKNLELWHIPTGGIDIIPPLGYLDFLKLMSHATAVLTDSGGIQEETTILGVPCLTLRENTERPVTVKEGTNQIVNTDEKKVFAALEKILKKKTLRQAQRDIGRKPKFWDGKAAERIVNILKKYLCSKFSSKKEISSLKRSPSRRFREMKFLSKPHTPLSAPARN